MGFKVADICHFGQIIGALFLRIKVFIYFRKNLGYG